MSVVEFAPLDEEISADVGRLMSAVKELYSYRHHTGARPILLREQNKRDIELCRDRLSRFLDGISGK